MRVLLAQGDEFRNILRARTSNGVRARVLITHGVYPG
jgi:hypothetical protein